MSATYYTLRPRGDTKTNWETNNPTLDEREMGVAWDEDEDRTNYAIKFGDGTKDWNSLPVAIDNNVTDKVVDTFSTESAENPEMTQGTTVSKLMGVIKKKFEYCVKQITTNLVTNEKFISELGKYVLTEKFTEELAKKVAQEAYDAKVNELNTAIQSNKTNINTLNSDSVRLSIPNVAPRKVYDFNTLTTGGFYSALGDNTNAPTAGNTHYIVLVIADNDIRYVRQIAFDVRSANIYTRTSSPNNIWTVWNKVTLTSV